MKISREDRIKGCLYGMAIGDGYGAPTEFLTREEILDRWPPTGPSAPEGDPILVTDDTQMALAVGQALINSQSDQFSLAALEENLIQEFIRWFQSPDNNRAPGMTCLQACEDLARGIAWPEATRRDSKGCGANMRVVPVGLLGHLQLSETQIGKIAQLQSALTHAHPTALAASELTALAVHQLARGLSSSKLIDYLQEHCRHQKKCYHQDWLGSIWERPPFYTAEEFIQLGWEQCENALAKISEGLNQKNRLADPCQFTGEGWIAEESLATGLLCFLLHPEEPTRALQQAVATTGDSDSIACLTGAFCGAYCGLNAFPLDWIEQIEYRDQLEALGDFYGL